MTRTIQMAVTTVILTLAMTASAQACLTTKPQAATLGYDRIIPNQTGSALRKEGELRGQQFLVSTQRPNR